MAVKFSSHDSCDWCGVLMGIEETATSEVTVSYGDNVAVIYHICYNCRKFPTPECVELWKGILVDWALLNIPIEIDSIKYEPPDALITITVKYDSELIPVRIGWVG